jgi:hypothetical protein
MAQLLTEKERLFQKKIEARLQAEINARKSKNVVRAGANLASQWGRVVTNEQRLIDNGHFMKSSERAALDYARERYKKAKNEAKGSTVIRVEKRAK